MNKNLKSNTMVVTTNNLNSREGAKDKTIPSAVSLEDGDFNRLFLPNF